MAERALAVVDHQKPTPIAVRAPSGPRLPLPTAAELTALQQYGDIIVKSGLAPAHIKSWQAAVVAMRFGHQLGVDEFTALQNLFVIGGKVSCMASLMHALILRDHGDDAIVPIEFTARSVTLACKRRNSAHATNVTYTVDEATKAGLTGGNWDKYPADMLFARCISRAGRMIFRDSTLGMYLPEEVGVNIIEVDGEVIDSTSRETTIEGEFTETPSPPSKDDHQRALAHYMAACAEAGLQDAASKLFAIAGYPMRGDEPTTSRKQLTATELDKLARNVKDWVPAVEYGEDGKTVISISILAECANDIAAATNQKRLAELAVKMKADGIAEKWLKAMWSTKNMQAPAAVEIEPEQEG